MRLGKPGRFSGDELDYDAPDDFMESDPSDSHLPPAASKNPQPRALFLSEPELRKLFENDIAKGEPCHIVNFICRIPDYNPDLDRQLFRQLIAKAELLMIEALKNARGFDSKGVCPSGDFDAHYEFEVLSLLRCRLLSEKTMKFALENSHACHISQACLFDRSDLGDDMKIYAINRIKESRDIGIRAFLFSEKSSDEVRIATIAALLELDVGHSIRRFLDEIPCITEKVRAAAENVLGVLAAKYPGKSIEVPSHMHGSGSSIAASGRKLPSK